MGLYKENENNAVIEELENIEQRIGLLNKLKNPELSDEKFLEILSLCYCYDISDLEEDIKANAKALFGVGDIKPVIIDTNLKFESGNYVRYDGYAPSFLKIKSLYTLSEIADLIKNHQLIIDAGVRLERSDDLKVFMTPEKQKEAESLIVSLKYFRNLGIYKD